MTEINPVDQLGRALTLDGYWDGSTIRTGLVRDSGAGTTGTSGGGTGGGGGGGGSTMKYGVSATNGGWPAAVNAQVTNLHASVAFYYGQNTRWGTWGSGVPDTMDLLVQTKADNRADYDALIASMPNTRVGKVYLFYWNEPEGQIKTGIFTMAQWQARTDALHAAIAAAPASKRAYIIPSIEIQYFIINEYLKGNNGVNNAYNVPMYIRPTTQYIGWSAFAMTKTVNGHDVATTSPVTMPKVLGDWMQSRYPTVNYGIVSGWALREGSAQYSDPITRQNRINWMTTQAKNVAARDCSHFMWFDTIGIYGGVTFDYRIASPPGPDPTVDAAWQQMLTDAGQW